MKDKENPEMISLQTDDPLPGVIGHFGLLLPTELSEESFNHITEQIEFRRRCMNQGFDNLLELLAMHKKVLMQKRKKTEDRINNDRP